MAKSHEKMMKLAIRDHTELSMFHARRAQALEKELTAWKRQQSVNAKALDGRRGD